jgi:hypothetical protein
MDQATGFPRTPCNVSWGNTSVDGTWVAGEGDTGDWFAFEFNLDSLPSSTTQVTLTVYVSNPSSPGTLIATTVTPIYLVQ